jgi:hypothetical protein
MEIWKDVEGYEGLYQVSSEGRVKSLEKKSWNGTGWFMRKEMILKPVFNSKIKYETVGLSIEGIRTGFYIHRLVAKHFISNPYNKSDVNHKNGDKHNNSVKNLEWVTPQENIEHSINVLGNTQFGELNNQSILSASDIVKIRNDKRRHIDIANDYGVCRTNIIAIKKYKTWKHIK